MFCHRPDAPCHRESGQPEMLSRCQQGVASGYVQGKPEGMDDERPVLRVARSTQCQDEISEAPHSSTIVTSPKLQLSNIKLVFLPPNMTSRLQLCNAAIIATVKLHYWKRLVRHVLAEMDTANWPKACSGVTQPLFHCSDEFSPKVRQINPMMQRVV